MKHLTLASFTLVAAALVGGCGSDASDRSEGPVTVELAEYSITMPATIAGPMVDLNITNVGAKAHELGIAQVEPGTTLEEATAFVKKGGREGEVLIDDPGGTTVIGAGASLGYTRTLTPGTYVFFCKLPAPDGTNHAQQGQITLFTVADGDESDLPKTDLTISLDDDAITVPALTAGKRVIAITNNGTRPHELWISGLPSDVDLSSMGAEIEEWIVGGQVDPAPVPVDFPGGIKTIDPGVTVVLTVTLKGGHTYMFSDYTGDEEITTVVEVP